MPKKGRGKSEELDPLKLPARLQTAMQALYGHYENNLSGSGRKRRIKVPPCFIVVCNNTSASKLVYDYISGFQRQHADGSSSTVLENGRLPLFRNYDEHGNPLAASKYAVDRQRTVGGGRRPRSAIPTKWPPLRRLNASVSDVLERTRDAEAAKNISDQDLLREVMNTVGKLEGKLGESIRCVVSVSMLTEGWDTNTVTHVLGVRAFGTQLLCEQVIGRALRRQSYDLNEEGQFNVEYADVFGIPFDFAAKPVIAPPLPPRETVSRSRPCARNAMPWKSASRVSRAIESSCRRNVWKRSSTTIRILELSPDLVGPSITRNSGIIGEGVDMSLEHLDKERASTVLFHVTKRLLVTHWRDAGDDPRYTLFGQLKRITKQWVDNYLICKGGTYPALLMYQELADMACNKITAGITRKFVGEKPIKATLDPYNPTGSTAYVNFNTSRTDRWETSSDRCHVNWVILDSEWPRLLCRRRRL